MCRHVLCGWGTSQRDCSDRTWPRKDTDSSLLLKLCGQSPRLSFFLSILDFFPLIFMLFPLSSRYLSFSATINTPVKLVFLQGNTNTCERPIQTWLQGPHFCSTVLGKYNHFEWNKIPLDAAAVGFRRGSTRSPNTCSRKLNCVVLSFKTTATIPNGISRKGEWSRVQANSIHSRVHKRQWGRQEWIPMQISWETCEWTHSSVKQTLS